MTPDELNTKAMGALSLLSTSADSVVREEFMKALLTNVYMAGFIDAQRQEIVRNAALIERNNQLVTRAA